MSFYDLTKDFVLSAKELFKYRGKRDSTVPSKGGHKDFSPDESWMQKKALEAFIQERTAVLSEPRVEKLKSLVNGVWDGDQKLVSVKKPGKFWAHMGFTDKRRNWLYPEEALFLMESNALEVYHGGVPLSIQEGYNMFLGHSVSIEEYQVFSHLRRLGYVVVRHESGPIITPYERQLNLDKYIGKQSRKNRKNKLLDKNKSTMKSKQLDETVNNSHSPPAKIPRLNVDDSQTREETNFSKDSDHHHHLDVNHHKENDHSESSLDNKNEGVEPKMSHSHSLSADTGTNQEETSITSHELNTVGTNSEPTSHESHNVKSSLEATEENCVEMTDISSTNSSCPLVSVKDVQESPEFSQQQISARKFYEDLWSPCFNDPSISRVRKGSDIPGETSCESETNNSCTSMAENIFEVEENSCRRMPLLPNMAETQTVVLVCPESRLLPENVEIENKEELLSFDVEKYRSTNPSRELSRQAQREEERETRIHNLEFSCPEWMQRKPRITAKSWREYRQAAAEVACITPGDHLWTGKVIPLVHPGEKWTQQRILERLSIIKSADKEALLPDSDCVVDVKITYDVHLPDGKFKKSIPGIPNHRVSICRCSSDLPGLAEIQQVQTQLRDNVPLHWAVVDCGEIAFYVFGDTKTTAQQ